MSSLTDATLLTPGRTGDFWARVDDSQASLVHTLTQAAAAGQGLFDVGVTMLRDFTGLPRPCSGWRVFKFQPQDVFMLPAQSVKTEGGRAEPDDEASPQMPDTSPNLPFPVNALPGYDTGIAAWMVRYPMEFVPRVIESADGPLLQGFDFILNADWLVFRQDPLTLFPTCHIVASSARDTGKGMLNTLLRLDAPGSDFGAVANYRFRNHSKRAFFEAACEAAGVGVSKVTGAVSESVTLFGGNVHLTDGGDCVETRADSTPDNVSEGTVPGQDLTLSGELAPPAAAYFPIGRFLGGRWSDVEVATGDISAEVWESEDSGLQILIPFVRRLADGTTEVLGDTDRDALNNKMADSLAAAGHDDLLHFLTGQNLTGAGYVAADPITLDVMGGLAGKGLLGKAIILTSIYDISDPRDTRLKSYVDRERPVGLPSLIIKV